MQPVLSCINAVFSRSSNKFTPRSFPGYHCVGWVKAAHGIRGELFVQLYAGQADWLNSLKEINLLEPGNNVLSTWTMEEARPHKGGLILKLHKLNDRNHSELLRKSGVYIPESILTAKPG